MTSPEQIDSGPTAQPAVRRRVWRRVAWGLGYVAMLAALVFGIFAARRTALDPSSQAANTRHWREFRQALREQAKSGPVARRSLEKEIPEPPTLVLLRDHFGVCLTAGVVFLSLLYGMLIVAASAIGQPTKIHGEPPPDDSGSG